MKTLDINGFTVKVDDEDWDRIKHITWSVSGNGYVLGTYNDQRPYMHREIMQPDKGQVVDHIDGDPLNNCRDNLRVTRQSHNVARNNRNGGVYQRESGRWTCVMMISGKVHRLGMFNTEQEAFEAREAFLKQHAPERL
jgi:hypothetical protein